MLTVLLRPVESRPEAGRKNSSDEMLRPEGVGEEPVQPLLRRNRNIRSELHLGLQRLPGQKRTRGRWQRFRWLGRNAGSRAFEFQELGGSRLRHAEKSG